MSVCLQAIQSLFLIFSNIGSTTQKSKQSSAKYLNVLTNKIKKINSRRSIIDTHLHIDEFSYFVESEFP